MKMRIVLEVELDAGAERRGVPAAMEKCFNRTSEDLKNRACQNDIFRDLESFWSTMVVTGHLNTR